MKQTFALQIFIPVFGLAVMSLIRDILASNADVLANQKVEIPIPHFFNLPLKSFNSLGLFFNITECDEYYLYQFANGTTQEDRDYFGYNEGVPLEKPRSAGMLKGGRNILESPCIEVNRSVPYFVPTKEGMTANEQVYKVLHEMSEKDLSLTLKHLQAVGAEEIPDGVLTVYEANKKRFNYTL